MQERMYKRPKLSYIKSRLLKKVKDLYGRQGTALIRTEGVS